MPTRNPTHPISEMSLKITKIFSSKSKRKFFEYNPFNTASFPWLNKNENDENA